MDIERIIEVIEHEKECVLRNVKNNCNRDCSNCDLLLPYTDIISAYNYTLSVLNAKKKELKNEKLEKSKVWH